MSVILANPPSNRDYSRDYAQYTQIPRPNDADMNAIVIGHKIQDKYEQGAWTPAQKTRVIAISLTVFAALAAIASTFIAFTLCPPIGFAAVALGIGTGIGLYIIFSRGPDLDDPKVRNKQIVKVATMSFQQLAETFSANDVVGYGLLRDRLSPISAKEHGKVYTVVTNLLVSKDHLDERRSADMLHADVRFDNGTEPARQVRDLRQENANMRRVVVNSSINALEDDRNPSVLGTVARVAYNSAETQNEINNEVDYELSIDKWKRWLQGEKECIHTAYIAAIQQFNTVYLNVCNRPNQY